MSTTGQSILFIPTDTEVTLNTAARDAEFKTLFKCMLNKLNRLELQLEKITDEEVDHDEGDIA